MRREATCSSAALPLRSATMIDHKTRSTPGKSVPAKLREAGDRAEVLGELHARPFEPLPTPRRVYHFAFLTTEAEARADRKGIAAMARTHGLAPPGSDAKFHRLDLPRWRLRWEQHTEFTTYSWDTGADARKPFAEPAGADLPDMTALQPGPLMVAVHLCLTRAEDEGPDLDETFHAASLCVVGVEGGAARLATDFKVDGHGFTRFLIESVALQDLDAGVLTQRVLELETYRTLALLGLPTARKAAPQVRRMENELSTVTRSIARAGDVEANHALLKELTALAAQLEAQAVETSYRFGASRAYHELVQARLSALGEEKLTGHTTLSAFLSRRLNPAIKTCIAVDERQQLLSGKLMRTADLLRTRVQFELEEQNRDLLASMNRRAQLQLRLQQTVEGLSVAAVSYYLVGLVSYVAKGAEEFGSPLSPSAVAAVSVPFVVVGVWWVVRRVRKHYTSADKTGP